MYDWYQHVTICKKLKAVLKTIKQTDVRVVEAEDAGGRTYLVETEMSPLFSVLC